MSKHKDLEECIICGDVRHAEWHHVPPQQVGGVLTFPLCLSCHEHVDRTRLADWSPSEAVAGLFGLWSKADKTERLLLMKGLRVIADASATVALLRAK